MSCNTNHNTTVLPSARPRDVGIPEEALCEFLDRMNKTNIPLHALLIMRHGKLVLESYYAPYDPHMLHRMFSICKSLNALAIGLLEADGKLSLDDFIVDYFPDKLPKQVHPYIAQMTIRDMLMMRTCHAATTYKYDLDYEWVKSFFTVEPTHQPGKFFRYDTSASHVLCALVERVSGQKMLDFLIERVLNKIGWSQEAYVLPNQFGDLQGGSGLMCTPKDLLLLGQLLLQHGEWQGEQLLPRDFVDTATSNLSPTFMTGPIPSEMQGYGYQIWRGERNNFVLYGMGGQLVICMPDYDMVVVTCADTQGIGGGNQLIYQHLYDTLLPAMDAFALGAYPMTLQEGGYTAYDRLQDKLSSLHIKAVCEEITVLPATQTCQKAIHQQVYHLAANEQGFETICLSFEEENRTGLLQYSLNGELCELAFGLEKCLLGNFPVYHMKHCSSGGWLTPNLFFLKCYLLDTSLGSIRFEFSFGEQDISVSMRKVEETLFNEYDGFLYGTNTPT